MRMSKHFCTAVFALPSYQFLALNTSFDNELEERPVHVEFWSSVTNIYNLYIQIPKAIP